MKQGCRGLSPLPGFGVEPQNLPGPPPARGGRRAPPQNVPVPIPSPARARVQRLAQKGKKNGITRNV